MSKFKVGDLVTGTKEHQWAYKKEHRIKSVTTFGGREAYTLDVSGSSLKWWAEELRLVKEATTVKGETPVQRRTFKQLKESVTVKKNALWQEACDDGTQEYILLDQTNNKDSRNTQRIYDRSLVEDDAANFVEVFAVTPQFMTREELDKWEAFKAVKPERKARAKTTKAPKKVASVSKAKAA